MHRKPAKSMSNNKIVVLLSLQQLVFVGFGYALWRWSSHSTDGFITHDWSQLGLGLIIGLGLIAVMAFSFRAMPDFMHQLIRKQGQSFSFLKEPLNRWQIIAMSIGAGVGEEALFRGGV